MRKIDKYIYQALFMRFASFLVILAALYWINKAILLFNRLLAQGYEVSTILNFATFTFPDALVNMAPISCFIALIVVFRRLIIEREMNVIQSLGWSPLRIAMPAIAFGLTVSLLVILLSGFLVPWARIAYNQLESKLAADFNIGILQAKKFIHPIDNVTVFINEIDDDGKINGWFMSDQRDPENIITYTAKHAVLANSASGVKIIMQNGTVQTRSRIDQKLSKVQFGETAYNLNTLSDISAAKKLSLRALTFLDLINADPMKLESIGAEFYQLKGELHSRIAKAGMPLVMILIALGCLLTKSFNRTGVQNQVLAAFFLGIFAQILFNNAEKTIHQPGANFGLLYLVLALLLSFGFFLLFIAGTRHLKNAKSIPGAS